MAENQVVQFFALLDPYWTPIGPLLDPYWTNTGAFRQPGDSALASNLGFCRPLPRPPRKSKIHGVGNPWGGKSLENPLTNPGVLETQISAKNQGLKTGWYVF